MPITALFYFWDKIFIYIIKFTNIYQETSTTQINDKYIIFHSWSHERYFPENRQFLEEKCWRQQNKETPRLDLYVFLILLC